MAVDFAANELECYIANSSATIESTVAGTFDSACSRCSMRVGFGVITDNALSPVYTARTTRWAHWEYLLTTSTSNSGSTMRTWINSSGTPVFRLQFTSSQVLQPQYWNGSAWTNIGATYSLSLNSRTIFDLKIVCGASGSMELYANNILVSSGSASMSAVTDIAQHRNGSGTIANGANNGTFFSQVIEADEPTIAWKYYTKPPTGNGANTAWTGSYTDVDETVYSDTDFIESTVANDVETFTGAAMTIPDGTVKAVIVSARTLQVAGGPQNMQAALRRGGTDYYSSNVTGLTATYAPVVVPFATDPSTGSAWTKANAVLAANEFGVKSIA